MQELPDGRWAEMWDDLKPQSALVRWAVITKIGRVVVEAETAEAAREKVERRGYIVLEVNRDNSSQTLSF
jgi:hypothetical protein